MTFDLYKAGYVKEIYVAYHRVFCIELFRSLEFCCVVQFLVPTVAQAIQMNAVALT